MRFFPQSIRWRIQLWYLLLLAGIIAALLVAFYRNQEEIKYQTIDRKLNSPITRLLPVMEGRREPPTRSRRPPRLESLDELKPDGAEAPPSRRRDARREEPSPRGPTLEEAVNELIESEIFVMRWDSDGDIRYASENAPAKRRAAPVEVSPGRDRVVKRTEKGYRELIHTSPGGGYLLLGTSLEPVKAELSALRTKLVGIGISIVGGGFLVGWLLIGRSLRPIEEISEAAHRIACLLYTSPSPRD